MSNKDKSGQKRTVSSKTPRPAGKGRTAVISQKTDAEYRHFLRAWDLLDGVPKSLRPGIYRRKKLVERVVDDGAISKKLEALSKAHSELERKVQSQERELVTLRGMRFGATLVPIERDAILTEDVEWALQRTKRSTTAQTIATAREAVNKMGADDLATAASRGDSERAELLAKSLAKLKPKP